MEAVVQGKIWANSGDSHFIEPDEAWKSLPPALAERMPRSVKDADGRNETVTIDGQSFRRRMPSPKQQEFLEMARRPGLGDVAARLADLDNEGIWAEVVYPSLGMWNSMYRDPVLVREAMRVSNDWVKEQLVDASTRLVPTAQVSMLSITDAIEELERTRQMGFKCVFMPCEPPKALPHYNDESWEPFWAACERTGMVLAFHIGTEPIDHQAGEVIGVAFRGAGGAVINHTHAAISVLRVTMLMVASGVLDRHPDLKMLVSESGASWVPFLGDRMDEAYRQHGEWSYPKLSSSPKEILYRQVYASFQHDVTAIPTMTAMGYQNVMWGSDYPHLEGTFGHTQETLHELFDGVDDAVRRRITTGSFLELFPDVGVGPPD
ncbi:MAG: amidohydrolase family protein [Ilumatobacteraceae bacterium]